MIDKSSLILGSAQILYKPKTQWKATLRRTLSLGFSTETVRDLGLKNYKAALLYFLSNPATDNIVYMQLLTEPNDDAYPIRTAGKFMHIVSAPFFEKLGHDLGIDFTIDRHIYDIKKVDADGEVFYELKGRRPKGGVYIKKKKEINSAIDKLNDR